MKFKSVQQFITYNNMVPIALGILFLGGALASAQTAGLSFDNFTEPAAPVHLAIDTSLIEQVDFENHDFNPTVDVVQETDRDYVLTVGIDDYDIRNAAWQSLRMQHKIEIRKTVVNSTEELQEKISVEVNDLVESRRMLLTKAQTMALESQQSSSVDLSSLLGGVTVQEEQVAKVSQELGSEFVQGSHRPEDRINPEQNIISTIVGFVADPFVESTLEPVISQTTQTTQEESSNPSDNGQTSSEISEPDTSEISDDNQEQSQEIIEPEAASTTASSTDTDVAQASSSPETSLQNNDQVSSTEAATTTASSTVVDQEETANEESIQEEPDSQETATSSPESQETTATEEETPNEEQSSATSSPAEEEVTTTEPATTEQQQEEEQETETATIATTTETTQ